MNGHTVILFPMQCVGLSEEGHETVLTHQSSSKYSVVYFFLCILYVDLVFN